MNSSSSNNPGPKEQLAILAEFTSQLASFDFRFTAVGNETSRYEELTPKALAFVDALGAAGWIIPFDWASWARSREGRKLLEGSQHVATATPDQLAKVLTVLTRAERFSEGTLNQAFKGGLLLALVRRAEALLNEP